MPNFEARAQILFHIGLSPILVKFAASCFISYPNVRGYLFSFVMQILSKKHGEIFRKECESASVKLHSTLYTFTVAGTLHII